MNNLTFTNGAYRLEKENGEIFEGVVSNLVAHFKIDTITITDRVTLVKLPIITAQSNNLKIGGQTKTFEQIKTIIETELAKGGGASSADAVSYDNTTSGLQSTNVQGAIDEIGANLGDFQSDYNTTKSKVDGLMDKAEVASVQAQNVGYQGAVSGATNTKDAIDKIANNMPTAEGVITKSFTDFVDNHFFSTFSAKVLDGGTNQNFASIILDCKYGDEFSIIGVGGASGRLWAFASDDRSIITRADENAGNVTSGVVAVCPQGATKLYINISKPSTQNYGSVVSVRYRGGAMISVDEFVKPLRKSIKLLAVGNSFTLNALQYLPFIFNSICPELDYTIAYAIIGGSSLQVHYNKMIDDSASYSYIKINKGDTAQRTIKGSSGKWSEIINDEKWDMITFQQVSGLSDNYATYQPYLNNIITDIYAKINKNIKFGWLIVPSKDTSLQGSITNFNNISASAKRVIEETAIEFILPCGTAVQNARTTSLQTYGDGGNLCTNDRHLQHGIAWMAESYSSALALLKLIGSDNISVFADKLRCTSEWEQGKGFFYTDIDNVGVSDDNCRKAQICAIMSSKKPYDITDCSSF